MFLIHDTHKKIRVLSKSYQKYWLELFIYFLKIKGLHIYK